MCYIAAESLHSKHFSSALLFFHFLLKLLKLLLLLLATLYRSPLSKVAAEKHLTIAEWEFNAKNEWKMIANDCRH